MRSKSLFHREVNVVEHLEARRLFAVAYSLLEIGSAAVGVNNSGIVIGQVSQGAFATAMYYDGVLHPLPNPAGPGVSSEAIGINNAGQIVGSLTNGNGVSIPFLFSDNVQTDLTTRGIATANAINDSDLVTGTAGKPSLQLTGPAYFTGAGGGAVTRLRSIHAFSPSAGLAVNDEGHIVGWSDLPNTSGVQVPHAYDFFSHTDFGRGSDNAVNNTGVSAGYVVTGSHQITTAFVGENGSRVLLGTLGGQSSKAYGINDSGVVVGDSNVIGSGLTHAFVYTDGTMVDLNQLIDPSLGVTLTNAFAINASGQIAGTLRDANGVTHGYLLTPTSESNEGPLSLAVKTSTLATSIIAGNPVNGEFTLAVRNLGGTVQNEVIQSALYLALNNVVDANSVAIGEVSRHIHLNPRATTVLRLSVTKLSTGIPAGRYHIIAQTTDAVGNTATSVAAPSITISDPKVILNAGLSRIRPAHVAPGGTASVMISLSNTGNVGTSGIASINLGFTMDGSTEAASFFTIPRRLHIGAGKSRKLSLSFKIPSTVVAGTYRPFVSITEPDAEVTAVAKTAWQIS